MISKFLVAVLAIVAISFAAVDNANAQAGTFKGQAKGTILKTSTAADEFNGVAVSTGTATSTVHAATLNTDSGTLTTEALTTAGLAEYTFTLTDSLITSASKVFVNVYNGTNTQGSIAGARAIPGTGTCDFKVPNLHATQALNGTLKIQFWVVK